MVVVLQTDVADLDNLSEKFTLVAANTDVVQNISRSQWYIPPAIQDDC